MESFNCLTLCHNVRFLCCSCCLGHSPAASRDAILTLLLSCCVIFSTNSFSQHPWLVVCRWQQQAGHRTACNCLWKSGSRGAWGGWGAGGQAACHPSLSAGPAGQRFLHDAGTSAPPPGQSSVSTAVVRMHCSFDSASRCMIKVLALPSSHEIIMLTVL